MKLLEKQKYARNFNLEKGDKLFYYKYSGHIKNKESWIGEVIIDEIKIKDSLVEVRLKDWRNKYLETPFAWGHKNGSRLCGLAGIFYCNKSDAMEEVEKYFIVEEYMAFNNALRKLRDLGYKTLIEKTI